MEPLHVAHLVALAMWLGVVITEESDDWLWASWLRSAHESSLQVVRRADHRPSARRRTGQQPPVHYELLPTQRIPYCAGCLTDHKTRMKEQGRCRPCDPDVLNPGTNHEDRRDAEAGRQCADHPEQRGSADR